MFRNRFNIFARFAPDTPQGGDGGAGENSGDNSPSQSFQRLLDRHNNDATALANRLFDENFSHRARARQLEAQVAELQGKLPGENALVLTGDDAKAFEAYKALGTADEVKERVEQATELQGKLDALERDAALRQVAESIGWKPSVLGQLDRMAKAAGKELAFELREQEVDGAKVQTPVIKDGDIEKSLADYAAAEWADFLPALTADAAPQGGNAGAASGAAGTRFPSQQPGATARKPVDLVDKHLQDKEEKRKAARNPLLPSAG